MKEKKRKGRKQLKRISVSTFGGVIVSFLCHTLIVAYISYLEYQTSGSNRFARISISSGVATDRRRRRRPFVLTSLVCLRLFVLLCCYAFFLPHSIHFFSTSPFPTPHMAHNSAWQQRKLEACRRGTARYIGLDGMWGHNNPEQLLLYFTPLRFANLPLPLRPLNQENEEENKKRRRDCSTIYNNIHNHITINIIKTHYVSDIDDIRKFKTKNALLIKNTKFFFFTIAVQMRKSMSFHIRIRSYPQIPRAT